MCNSGPALLNSSRVPFSSPRLFFWHLTTSEYGYICTFPPRGTTGPSATYFSLALYFLNQELIGRICWHHFRCDANTSEIAWLYCLKTLVADKSCREIMHMGGLWARPERHAAVDKLKSVFVPQHSQYPNSQLQCCVFLVPDLLPRLLCIYQPASFPLHGPDTEKGEGKGTVEEGRRANKYLGFFSFYT